MRIEELGCDRKECKNRDAHSFQLFADRKDDGAGGMENWYFQFDLCRNETDIILFRILESEDFRLDKFGKDSLLKVLKSIDIKMRRA